LGKGKVRSIVITGYEMNCEKEMAHRADAPIQQPIFTEPNIPVGHEKTCLKKE